MFGLTVSFSVKASSLRSDKGETADRYRRGGDSIERNRFKSDITSYAR